MGEVIDLQSKRAQSNPLERRGEIEDPQDKRESSVATVSTLIDDPAAIEARDARKGRAVLKGLSDYYDDKLKKKWQEEKGAWIKRRTLELKEDILAGRKLSEIMEEVDFSQDERRMGPAAITEGWNGDRDLEEYAFETVHEKSRIDPQGALELGVQYQRLGIMTEEEMDKAIDMNRIAHVASRIGRKLRGLFG